MINNLYETIEDIGQGAYGKVVKARDKHTGRLVAIKQLKTQSTEEGIPQTTLREITFLKDLDHPNIVKLLNVVWFLV
jgi:cyclin-dependent kinase